MKTKLNIFTNGFEGTWPAIEYGAQMAGKLGAHVTLTGVVEPTDADHPVEDIYSRAVSLFQDIQLEYSLELSNGLVEDVISRRFGSQADAVDGQSVHGQILVVGPFGRPPVQRMIVGNSFRKIMSLASQPILYVPAVRLPIGKVLVCMGGLGYTQTASAEGVKIAGALQASVTFMTVVPPVDMDYPEARIIRDNWKKLAETDTLPGRSLRDGLKMAQSAGLEAKIKIRHGNILEQILMEIKEGGYDLVCMGSQFSTKGLRQLYTPNITADVAEVSQCPILTVRYIKSEE